MQVILIKRDDYPYIEKWSLPGGFIDIKESLYEGAKRKLKEKTEIYRLRNKVEYTPIAFNLLPRLFTVKELQNVYEAIMGREILNFRRKMGEMIIETDEKIEDKAFRPAKIYKFNENWEHNF